MGESCPEQATHLMLSEPELVAVGTSLSGRNWGGLGWGLPNGWSHSPGSVPASATLLGYSSGMDCSPELCGGAPLSQVWLSPLWSWGRAGGQRLADSHRASRELLQRDAGPLEALLESQDSATRKRTDYLM